MIGIGAALFLLTIPAQPRVAGPIREDAVPVHAERSNPVMAAPLAGAGLALTSGASASVDGGKPAAAEHHGEHPIAEKVTGEPILFAPEFSKAESTDMSGAVASCQTVGSRSLMVTADWIHWRPRTTERDFAILNPGQGLTSGGGILSIPSEPQSGFRLGAIWNPDGRERDFGLRYTHLFATADALATALPGTTLLATRTRPGSPAEVLAASARETFDLDILDAEVGVRLLESGSQSLRGTGGVRGVWLDRQNRFAYAGLDTLQTGVSDRTLFEGGGLTAGLEYRRGRGNGFGFFATGRTSLVAGGVENRLTQISDGGVITNWSSRQDAVVTILDLSAGVAWRRGSFDLMLGYELSHWLGLGGGLDVADDLHPGKVLRRNGDLSFDGLMLRAGWRW
jgi:hypothetical protein